MVVFLSRIEESIWSATATAVSSLVSSSQQVESGVYLWGVNTGHGLIRHNKFISQFTDRIWFYSFISIQNLYETSDLTAQNFTHLKLIKHRYQKHHIAFSRNKYGRKDKVMRKLVAQGKEGLKNFPSSCAPCGQGRNSAKSTATPDSKIVGCGRCSWTGLHVSCASACDWRDPLNCGYTYIPALCAQTQWCMQMPQNFTDCI